jgi:membrane protease YdiL (CAAX protease family)
MKTFLRKETCQKCGTRFDPALGECPKCKEKLPIERGANVFASMAPMGVRKELVLFFSGWIGFQIIGTIVSYFIQSVAQDGLLAAGFSGASLRAGLLAYVKTGAYQAAVNDSAYLILFVLLISIVGPDCYRLWKTFRNPKTYAGFLVGFGMIFVSAIYSMILAAFGYTNNNANQTAVIDTIKVAPFFAVICMGIIGPFCEELTYRVGLFGFGKRINVYLAYFIASVVFGFIHMHFLSQNSSGQLYFNNSIDEWVTLPDYIISGLILAFTYDKLGFGASFIAHATNNTIAILEVILLSSKAS